MRAGRFGVGVFAAFLLGPQIAVVTRHVTAAEDQGLEFVASLEDEHIQLRRCSTKVGTRVAVRLNEQVYQRLVRPLFVHLDPEEIPWNWYRYDWPRLIVAIGADTPGTPSGRNTGSS